jgi:hypothetical protein
MFELIRRYEPIRSTTGKIYRPRAYGARLDDLSWGGWLVFFPLSEGTVVATTRETAQGSFESMTLWAAGLSTVDLHSALERALELEPEPLLTSHLRGLERLEHEAVEQAEILEGAAAVARRTAEVAAERRTETASNLANAAADAARESARLHEEAAAASRVEAEILEHQAAEEMEGKPFAGKKRRAGS